MIARDRIKEAIPAIRKILQENVPTHSWSYDQLMRMFTEDDILYTVSLTTPSENFGHDNEVGINKNEMGEDADVEDVFIGEEIAPLDGWSHNGSVAEQSSSTHSQEGGVGGEIDLLERAVDLQEMLANPSIQIYPQHHSQVTLNAVQNMSQVFDDLYDAKETRRRSARLSERPRRDFTQYK